MLLKSFGNILWIPIFIAGILFFPIARLHYGNANFADLGFFVDSISSVANGDYRLAFYGHVQIFMFPIAFIAKYTNILYLPYILVGTQSLVIALTLIVLYFKVNKNAGIIFALYFPTWYIALFDFHFDVLVLLLSAIIFSLVKERNFKSALLFILFLCFVKEPYCLVAFFFCIYAFIENLKEFNRKNLYLIVVVGIISIIIFFLYTDWLIPHFSNNDIRFQIGASSFSKYGQSILEVIKNLTLHPFDFIVSIFLDALKLKYIAVLFSAVLFLPFLAPKYLLPALPILVISMLSIDPSHYSIRNHYTAGVEIPIVVGAAYGLDYLKNKFNWLLLRKTWFVVNLFFSLNILFTPSPLGTRFYSAKLWDFYYDRYYKNSNYVGVAQYVKAVVSNSHVDKIYIQNNIFTLFENVQVKYIDESIEECAIKNCIIIIDWGRPLFWADKGCEYTYGRCQDSAVEEILKNYMKNILMMYKPTYLKENFVVYQRS